MLPKIIPVESVVWLHKAYNLFLEFNMLQSKMLFVFSAFDLWWTEKGRLSSATAEYFYLSRVAFLHYLLLTCLRSLEFIFFMMSILFCIFIFICVTLLSSSSPFPFSFLLFFSFPFKIIFGRRFWYVSQVSFLA